MLEDLHFPERNRTYSCRVRTFYQELNESDQKILMNYLADQTVSHLSLAKALALKTGQSFGDNAIRKHRLGLCSCSKI